MLTYIYLQLVTKINFKGQIQYNQHQNAITQTAISIKQTPHVPHFSSLPVPKHPDTPAPSSLGVAIILTIKMLSRLFERSAHCLDFLKAVLVEPHFNPKQSKHVTPKHNRYS